MSQREKDFQAEYRKATEALKARSHGYCEARIRGVCWREARHAHHRRPRRVRRDGKANLLANLLHICLPCHDHIHRNPRWARENGYILSTESDPELAPGAAVAPHPGH